MHFIADLDIVVTVYSQNLFHYIAGAVYIHTVCRDGQMQNIRIFGFSNIEFKGFEDASHQFTRKFLADKSVAVCKGEIEFFSFNRSGQNIDYTSADFSPGKFLDQRCRQSGGVYSHRWVCTAFIAE